MYRMEGMRDNTNEQTFFLRTHQGTRISPGKRLIDLNMGMTHRHELNGDAADDSTTNKGSEVADEDVILVLGAAVVHLTGDMIDERLRPGRDVLLEQSVESVVQCGADKVATCIHPSRKHGELEDINSKSCNGQVLPRQRMGGKNHLPQPFIVSQAFYQAFGNGLYIKHD